MTKTRRQQKQNSMPNVNARKRKSATASETKFNHESDDVLKAPVMCFSQQPAEASQGILPAKVSEQRNFDNLRDEDREKVLLDLSRLILFKALAGEPIDRKGVCKEAGIGPDQGRISTAAFSIARDRLRDVFGFELKRLPRWMEKQESTKKKYSERHYLILGDMDGGHTKAMYSVHSDISVEKGLLMVVLGLVFCNGVQRSDGSRWILEADLFRLLNALDENIPNVPLVPGARKRPGRFQTGEGQETPNVDTQLEYFVKLDYLIKEKITEEQLSSAPTADENAVLYSLGPRAALEVGRRQIVGFCSEVLDERGPDPQMLEEIEREEAEDEKTEK